MPLCGSQRTAKGRRLLYDALQIVATIEAGYARHLGARQMRELKSTLALLLEHIDPSGSLAAG